MLYVTKVKQITIILLAGILFAAILLCYDYIQEHKEIAVMNQEQDEISEQLGNVTAVLTVDHTHITDETNADVRIQWWFNKADEKYYFLFPSSADLTNIRWEYDGPNVMRMDGTPIANGTSWAITPGEHLIDEGEGTEPHPVVVMQSANLGAIFLSTKSGNLGFINIDKEHEESGTAVVLAADGTCTYNGDIESIAGRGNTTWDSSDKRGYQIKFPGKEDIYGMGAAKKWVLLANYFDESLLRNDFTYHLAAASDMPYTPESIFVDLYMNGYYWGNYQISEKIEVDEERVNIPDLQKATEERNPDKDLSEYDRFGMESLERSNSIPDTSMGYEIPNEPADITGGYLLEFDIGGRYIHENSGFATKLNQPVVIKSPQYASQAQVDYISDLYQQFEDAVSVYEGVNADNGKYYYDYIDVDSFAKAYLIEEITKNVDATISSRYFYKYPDSYSNKFFAGPVWDYDFALGNYGSASGSKAGSERAEGSADVGKTDDAETIEEGITDETEDGYDPSNNMFDPAGLFAMQSTDEFNIWYALYYRAEFQQAFKDEYWNTFRENALEGATERMKKQSELIETSALMDRIRWFGVTYENIESEKIIFEENVSFLQEFIVDRIAYLDEEWAIQEE